MGRSEGAPHHPTGGLEAVEAALHHRGGEVEVGGGLLESERAVGAGEAPHHVAQRIGNRFEEHLGHAGRGLDSEGIAQAGGVLYQRPSGSPADVHRDHPPLVDQLPQGLLHGHVPAAFGDRRRGQRSQLA